VADYVERILELINARGYARVVDIAPVDLPSGAPDDGVFWYLSFGHVFLKQDR
jgi:hypothetical protein